MSDEEQRERFTSRIEHPEKRWKLSTMDLASRARWIDYSEAEDTMFAHTDTPTSPWWVVDADDKRRARLDGIQLLLQTIDHEEPFGAELELPPVQSRKYRRPPIGTQRLVADHHPKPSK